MVVFHHKFDFLLADLWRLQALVVFRLLEPGKQERCDNGRCLEMLQGQLPVPVTLSVVRGGLLCLQAGQRLVFLLTRGVGPAAAHSTAVQHRLYSAPPGAVGRVLRQLAPALHRRQAGVLRRPLPSYSSVPAVRSNE